MQPEVNTGFDLKYNTMTRLLIISCGFESHQQQELISAAHSLVGVTQQIR